jgi:pyruvate dehydrogenase E1 component alpha subunit
MESSRSGDAPSTTHRSQPDPDDRLVELYRHVLRARELDARLAELHRQGIVGAHRSYAGEEAALVGAIAGLNDDDWVAGEGHELPAALARGADFSEVIVQHREPLTSRRRFLVAAGWRNGAFVTHGVGVAWGAKIERADRAALVTLSDATLPTGEFHNGLNFAGVFKVPVIFLARLRAEGPPRTRAYGLHGVTCDGSDLLAVLAQVREARARASAGEGPTWIEARIPAPGETIDRLRRHLEGRRLWGAADDARVTAEIDTEFAEALAQLEKAEARVAASGAEGRAALFEHTFQTLPWNLREQRELALQRAKT